MIGKRISHYRILAKLGEGGMGIVYKAEDEKLHRLVALRVLRPETLGDEDCRNRFLREASTATTVAHPFVTAIHNADASAGVTLIAMEYVDGRTRIGNRGGARTGVPGPTTTMRLRKTQGPQ